MRPAHRRIALARMEILMEHALSNARTDPDLARRQASLARRISTRHRICMPYRLRMSFCRHCKSFIAPGVNARIRVGGSTVRSVRITCLLCGHIHRKIPPQ